MLTLEKLTAAAQELPAEFSLGQLINKLLAADRPAFASPIASKDHPVKDAEDSATIESIFGIAASLSLADQQKSAKEWEAERIREKYGV